MTHDPITPAQTDPPGIELMGALCSLLIHDFANHLSVINGNAQCVHLFSNDPQRAASAVSAILQASETAAGLLVKCGDLRRSLADGFPAGDLSLLAGCIADYAVTCPGWSVNVPLPLAGRAALPPYWIAFTAFEFAKETKADRGDLSLATMERAGKRPSASALVTDPACHESLQVKLSYKSDIPFPFDQIRAKHTNLKLLAACELVKTVGGRTACAAASPTDQEITIWIPVT